MPKNIPSNLSKTPPCPGKKFPVSLIFPFLFKKEKNKFKDNQVKIFNDFKEIKLKKLDLSVAAIPGIAGLEPTLLFIKLSKKILIANKESIICGWPLIKKLASKTKTKI